MKTYINDKEFNLQYESVINCNIPYKQIFGLKDDDNVNCIIPYKTDRLQSIIDGKHDTKNLDLATFLMILKHENVEITIPEYENTTVSKIKSNEIIADDTRHGKVLNLKSNQNTFNFSVVIADKKYHEKKFDGSVIDFCPKTYTITDEYGNFHNNWDKFHYSIDNIGDLHFDKFVNSQLAQGYYSEYYRTYKAMIERLSCEGKYLRALRKKYLPLTTKVNMNDFVSIDDTTKVIKESADQFTSVKILCFESIISNLPDFNFNYIDEKDTPDNIVKRCNDLLDGIIGLASEYRFICRLIECAFVKVNPKYTEDLNPNSFIKYNRCDCKWNEQKVKLPKGKILWYELMFKDYSILCRYYYKSIQKKIK